MLFHIKNQNISTSYPLIQKVCDVTEKFYKETGFTDTVIELTNMEDVISLMSCCKASDDSFKGLLFTGVEIIIESEDMPYVI